MNILEMCSIFLIIVASFICSKTDLKEGLIYNKALLLFAGIAILVDLVYYGFFVRDLFFDFLLNLIIIALISTILFLSNSYAGGDSKMTIVFSLLYPARLYIVYGNTNLTLYFTIGISLIVGFMYLLMNSIWSMIVKKEVISKEYVIQNFKMFFSSYFKALIYLSLFNIILIFIGRNGLYLNEWITRIICFVIAWFVGKNEIFHKKGMLIGTFLITLTCSILMKQIPISLNPEHYYLIFILLFCQMFIKTNIYETIKIIDLKPGMILSTACTLPMQLSITPGLPKVSKEDLSNRLTNEEIDSIKLWAKATKVEELIIVKKIPFAIFVSAGFIIYFIIWSTL